MKEPNLNHVMSQACPRWSILSNHLSDAAGRIIVIWKNPVSVTLLHQLRQAITYDIQITGGHKFIWTYVYATNTREERCDLWCELLQLHQAYSLSTVPWVLCGDFNQIIHPVEHSSTKIDHLTLPMLELRDCFLQMDMFDLRYQGVDKTWTNKGSIGPISEKLDRLLVNNNWIFAYPLSAATFLANDIFDHSPCILNLASPLPISETKPFRFFNFLTKHHIFLSTISSAWIDAGNYTPVAKDLSSLCAKLKSIKKS